MRLDMRVSRIIILWVQLAMPIKNLFLFSNYINFPQRYHVVSNFGFSVLIINYYCFSQRIKLRWGGTLRIESAMVSKKRPQSSIHIFKPISFLRLIFRKRYKKQTSADVTKSGYSIEKWKAVQIVSKTVLQDLNIIVRQDEEKTSFEAYELMSFVFFN